MFSETLFLLSEGPIRAPAISEKAIIQKVTQVIFESFSVTHKKERTKICWNEIYTLPTVEVVKEALKTLCDTSPPANKMFLRSTYFNSTAGFLRWASLMILYAKSNDTTTASQVEITDLGKHVFVGKDESPGNRNERELYESYATILADLHDGIVFNGNIKESFVTMNEATDTYQFVHQKTQTKEIFHNTDSDVKKKLWIGFYRFAVEVGMCRDFISVDANSNIEDNMV